MVKGNLVVGQSGGPTVVINQSLIGIVNEAKKCDEIGGIYGARNGVVGIMGEDFIDLRNESDEVLEKVANTPASALGTCRHKPTKEDCGKILSIFQKYDVRYFFYIGGNDSAESASIINDIARERNYDIKLFHVPKTIDNDLVENDHTPGYASAARYVALCFLGNDLDNRALPGVKIDVVMGRHAGWLTAAAALAKTVPDGGPHLIYLPEKPITLDQFCDDIKKCLDKFGRALVAISEGTRSPDGKVLLQQQIKESDAFGNIQLSGSGALGDFLTAIVKEKLGKDLRVRSDTLGYAQRSFPGIVSEVDAREARMVGEAAVKFAAEGIAEGSVVIKRTGEGEKYASEASLVKLSQVARKTRHMPDEFLNKEGNGITEKFLDYIRPLVGELPPVSYLAATAVTKL